MSTEAVRRDSHEFATKAAAEAHAYELNAQLPKDAGRYYVVAGSPWNDLFYVVDAAGSHQLNPEPAQPINPFGAMVRDRSEPASSTSRGIQMTEPDERGITRYTGTRRHG